METNESEEKGAADNFAAIARTNWTCLMDAFGTGAVGVDGATGAELLTQHGLSQAHRLQHDCASVCASTFTGSTHGVTASNKLNKIANVGFN